MHAPDGARPPARATAAACTRATCVADCVAALPSSAECIKGNTLCNGQGVCGYDNDAQKARCFCNTGFEGDDCLTVTQPSSGMSIETVFLIIMVILITVAMFAAGYMVYRLRRLTIDPAAYAELSHRFNELGMVTG